MKGGTRAPSCPSLPLACVHHLLQAQAVQLRLQSGSRHAPPLRIGRQRAQARQASPVALLRFTPRPRGTTAEELSWLIVRDDDFAADRLQQLLALGCQASRRRPHVLMSITFPPCISGPRGPLTSRGTNCSSDPAQLAAKLRSQRSCTTVNWLHHRSNCDCTQSGKL